MDFQDLGKEVGAVGLGLDCSGAIYLGLSMLRSPMYAASVLFSDELHPGLKGKISTLSVDETAMSMLQARAGVALLLLGFLLQLVGSVLPAQQNHWGPAIVAAGAAVLIARFVCNRWIDRNLTLLREAIWASPRVTILVDREAMRRRPSTGATWQESRWVIWLRVRFQPSDYRHG
ncbi:MAG TPA: hypothetical protein PKA66_12700 [Gemmatimonadales bacterium]|nr:hypothetical protein [Gemmatimonadales bacterium]